MHHCAKFCQNQSVAEVNDFLIVQNGCHLPCGIVWAYLDCPWKVLVSLYRRAKLLAIDEVVLII